MLVERADDKVGMSAVVDNVGVGNVEVHDKVVDKLQMDKLEMDIQQNFLFFFISSTILALRAASFAASFAAFLSFFTFSFFSLSLSEIVFKIKAS